MYHSTIVIERNRVNFGIKKVAKILSRLGMGDAKDILEDIEAKDKKLAQRIRELMFGFEDLLTLNEKELLVLHQKIDKKELLLALKGASTELKEKFLAGMSSRQRELFLEELELMGKVKRKDVEAAQQRIAELVRTMIENGEISPGDAWIE